MDLLVELEDEAQVRRISPDFGEVAALDARGIIVTARASGHAGSAPHDFVSRFFAPRVGVPEDPVTGSAHCCLGPYWAEKLGKTEVVGYQASPRGGIVRVRIGAGRVFLLGQAVTILRGVLC
jgi:predicted PhzF superfamily epimerase YddE/YHI9